MCEMCQMVKHSISVSFITGIFLFREGELLFIMLLKDVTLLMIRSLGHYWTKDVVLTLKIR